MSSHDFIAQYEHTYCSEAWFLYDPKVWFPLDHNLGSDRNATKESFRFKHVSTYCKKINENSDMKTHFFLYKPDPHSLGQINFTIALRFNGNLAQRKNLLIFTWEVRNQF